MILKYYKENTCKEETKEVLYGITKNLRITIDNPDIYFVYDYAL